MKPQTVVQSSWSLGGLGYELPVIGGRSPHLARAMHNRVHDDGDHIMAPKLNMTAPHLTSCWPLLVYLLLIEPIHAFSSCAPPRFNVFTETIASSWHVGQDDNVQVAEEVMRSCGGAVQGVREIPLVSCLYLNRANDGFVFFDNGSYTHGPVQIGENGAVAVMTTSLTLCNKKTRLLLTCTLDAETSSSTLDSAHVVHRAFGDTESLSFTQEDFGCEIAKDAQYDDIIWNHQVQCQMSSTGQPWMLQRAKWESEGSGDDSLDLELFNHSLEAWTNVHLSDRNDATETNTVACLTWTIGVLCKDSGSVKLVTRKYNEKGMLSLVSLQTGIIENSLSHTTMSSNDSE